jgi:predicted secreted protein
MRVITLEADGAAADVAPGERLELRLPENAGTGEHRFVLHADAPGETTLVARHTRPWAPDSELRRFRLTIRVR